MHTGMKRFPAHFSLRSFVDFKRIPPSGVYHLVLRLKASRRIRVGALGVISFPAGYYTYTGRAMRGLAARLTRHTRRKKPLRWHIDYFRNHAEFVEIRIIPATDPGEEERLAEILLRRARKALDEAALPAPGFGSSDSRLPSHLIYWGASVPEIHGGPWGRPAPVSRVGGRAYDEK